LILGIASASGLVLFK